MMGLGQLAERSLDLLTGGARLKTDNGKGLQAGIKDARTGARRPLLMATARVIGCAGATPPTLIPAC